MPGRPTKAATAFAIRWTSSEERPEGSWTGAVAVELSGGTVDGSVEGVVAITQVMFTHDKEQLNRATVAGCQGAQLIIIPLFDLNLYTCALLTGGITWQHFRGM